MRFPSGGMREDVHLARGDSSSPIVGFVTLARPGKPWVGHIDGDVSGPTVRSKQEAINWVRTRAAGRVGAN